MNIHALLRALLAATLVTAAAARQPTATETVMQAKHPMQDFDVIELRRYEIRDGVRDAFATYFESWFPEAFQQLGAIAFGDGLERGHPNGFTWLRGFRDMPARAAVNTAFYYGPVWREHRDTLNALMIDSDNVLLLAPLGDEYRVTVLPAVDVVGEAGGAQGIVVMQVFAIRPGGVGEFATRADPVFARYRNTGVRQSGLLATLDEPNNFPQLPVREDGPYVVWLGIARDEAMLDAFKASVTQSRAALAETQLLRDEAELVVIDPAPRSRLRWVDNPEF